MLKIINERDVMTKKAARTKYPTKYFIMIITDVVDKCDNDLGYVIYTADKEKELIQIPKDEYIGKNAAFLLGGAAEPFPSLGNVVYHDQD